MVVFEVSSGASGSTVQRGVRSLYCELDLFFIPIA
jgi:hypothetical protein